MRAVVHYPLFRYTLPLPIQPLRTALYWRLIGPSPETPYDDDDDDDDDDNNNNKRP